MTVFRWVCLTCKASGNEPTKNEARAQGQEHWRIMRLNQSANHEGWRARIKVTEESSS